MSSLVPTKKRIKRHAIMYWKSCTASFTSNAKPISSVGKKRQNASIVPAKIIIPPIVGTLFLWTLRSSLGSSTKCLILATLIKEGVATKTTPKAVRNARRSSVKID